MKRDAVLPVDRLLAGYNLILAGVWVTLLPAVSYAPVILAAHLAGLAVPGLLRRAPTAPSRLTVILRDLYPYVWLGAFWGELDLLRVLLHGLANDGPVAALESALFGVQVSEAWIEAMPYVWLSELMHASYSLYYVLIVLPPLFVALRGRMDALRDITLRLMVAYLSCYLIYIAFPVDGPNVLAVPYEGALTGGFFYQLVHAIEVFGDSRGAAFPSSHVVGAVTIAYLGWRWFRPWVAVLLMVEAFGVIASTVYTQNHYAVDSLAGIVWALAVNFIVFPVLIEALRPGRIRHPVPVLPRFTPASEGARR